LKIFICKETQFEKNPAIQFMNKMSKNVICIVGGFYGDEGKGRIVAAVAKRENVKVVARASGGTNCGHTVVFEGKTYGIRQIPSAALDCPSASLVIGPGALVDPEVALKEIQLMGLNPSRLVIDKNCAIIEQRHRLAETSNEHLMKTVGSTGSGTGAAMAEHVLRCGPIARDCQLITSYVGDSVKIVHDALLQNEKVLIEGTQATFLSLYHGDYPFCTSKDVCASSMCADVGVGPCHVRDVILVFKAYVTRVGNGFLKNELSSEETQQRGWAEYGVVTGRPRRAAPFDYDLAKKSILLNSATKLAICKMDILFPEIAGATEVSQLSAECMSWIRHLESECGVPVYCIGTGPDAKETVFFNI